MTKWHNLKFAAAKHIIFKTNHALDNARRGTKMIIRSDILKEDRQYNRQKRKRTQNSGQNSKY